MPVVDCSGKTVLVFLLVAGASAQAVPARVEAAFQQSADVDNGPPVPIPPEIVARDAQGRVTLRAIRLTRPLRIDGRLDEEVYQTVPPVSDFIRTIPKDVAPASERTEAWVMYDDNYIPERRVEDAPRRRRRLVADRLG